MHRFFWGSVYIVAFYCRDRVTEMDIITNFDLTTKFQEVSEHNILSIMRGFFTFFVATGVAYQ